MLSIFSKHFLIHENTYKSKRKKSYCKGKNILEISRRLPVMDRENSGKANGDRAVNWEGVLFGRMRVGVDAKDQSFV